MKILVVYYSIYGHVLQLARAVEQGAKSVAGVVLGEGDKREHIESWLAS
jgi:hypothetical protein